MADASEQQSAAMLYLSKSGATKAGALLGRDFRVLTAAPDAAKSMVDGFGGVEKFSVIAQGEAAVAGHRARIGISGPG